MSTPSLAKTLRISVREKSGGPRKTGQVSTALVCRIFLSAGHTYSCYCRTRLRLSTSDQATHAAEADSASHVKRSQDMCHSYTRKVSAQRRGLSHLASTLDTGGRGQTYNSTNGVTCLQRDRRLGWFPVTVCCVVATDTCGTGGTCAGPLREKGGVKVK